MIYTFADYRKAADLLELRLGSFRPEIVVILGSGLSAVSELVQEPVVIPYEEIPGFRKPTAPGHAGQLVMGSIAGRSIAIMRGRLHGYEGYTAEEICFPLRVLRLLGADKMIITNAAGGVNLDFRVGDICLITDHIKLIEDSPLRGENIPEFGTRFPDASRLYTPRLQDVARGVAASQRLALREGVYMLFPGPNYETPAEVRAARILGADLVGMSTVSEALAAGHAGMEVLGFSLVTNAAAGVVEGATLTEDEVLLAGQATKQRFSNLILGCIRDL